MGANCLCEELIYRVYKVGENRIVIPFIITTSTPCRIQAMIHRGLSFCTMVEVVLLYQRTVKVILSVRRGEYQKPSRLHNAISGLNSGWGKTEHQGRAAACRAIGPLLLGRLRSQFHQCFHQWVTFRGDSSLWRYVLVIPRRWGVYGF